MYSDTLGSQIPCGTLCAGFCGPCSATSNKINAKLTYGQQKNNKTNTYTHICKTLIYTWRIIGEQKKNTHTKTSEIAASILFSLLFSFNELQNSWNFSNNNNNNQQKLRDEFNVYKRSTNSKFKTKKYKRNKNMEKQFSGLNLASITTWIDFMYSLTLKIQLNMYIYIYFYVNNLLFWLESRSKNLVYSTEKLINL